MLDLNTVFTLNQDIVLRGAGDKYWALDVSTGNQYKLNEIAYFILNLFRIPQSIEQVLERVLIEYNVTRDQLIVDCDKVLQIAIEQNIVREVK